MARGIQSIVLGFRLLQTIADAGVPLSLKAIAALSGMSPSKARMYLISFIETGLVTQNPASQLYGLGPYALRLGARALQRMDFIAVATDAMTTLQRQTRGLVLLGAWNEHGISVVARSEGDLPQPLQFPIGVRASLAGTATGHIFLAFGSQGPVWQHLQQELAALGLNRTEQKQRRKVLEELAVQVRARRLAETDPVTYSADVTLSGYAAVAAPVFDAAQQLRYAMTLVYPTGRDAKRRREFSKLTREAAERASHLAGADTAGLP
ncbi:MAG TPA: IclR family transcriptional regulator [Steroidobacteraceae bacterium]|nr:IclR family transcriptional regulator [Steroidobacteraceae bacterium]